MKISGIHDMGGVPGYGHVEPEADEPIFHNEWEGRIFGLVITVKDGLSRPRLEGLDPDEYLSGYYQRWLLAFERGLVARGALRVEELDAKTEYFRNHPAASPTRVVDPELTDRVRQGVYRQRDVRKTPTLVTVRAVGHTHASA
ncbi:MAG: nitrile hydratase subunit beta [Chloroflexi bacterium]|nr:nitrile hydratase subunit beta [Chloroflexota bacterium]